MTARLPTRAAFLAALLGAGLFAAPAGAQATRNAEVERYVEQNAAAALAALGDQSISSAERRRTFDRLMAQFADMPRIANFVLGAHGARLRQDAVLRSEWTRTFQEYSIAVYEDRLDRYSGGQVRVIGSIERTPGRDVIVRSEITPRGGRPLPVDWRLMHTGESWKVVDVSLIIDGNQIWLAQQQQREFLAALDRNNGDVRALMREIHTLTASLRERIVARNA